jgi:hypothetical protein
MSDNLINFDGTFYNFQCPHCLIGIEVMKNQLNCKIFRCGVFKNNNQPIPPHSSKIICDELYKNNLIYGCGKPFRVVDNYVEVCDYI